MTCPKAPNLVQIQEREPGHWKECGPPNKPEFSIAVCRLTSQWSGRLRATRSGAAHRRVRFHRKRRKSMRGIPTKLCRLVGVILDAADRPALAITWWRRAAALGDAFSQNDLAVRYIEGRGATIDLPTALTWLRLAAGQDNMYAQANLGLLYYEGKGVEQDLTKAKCWYTLAAEKGHPESQYNLGLMHENGEGGSPDVNRAKAWYEAAAIQGLAEAQTELLRFNRNET